MLPVYAARGRSEKLVEPAWTDDHAHDEATRHALIEGVIEESEDEALMERYLGGEDIDRQAARRPT